MTYEPSYGTGVVNVNDRLAERVSGSDPLFSRTTCAPPDRPEIVPPIVNDWVEQTTDTFETFAATSTPLPFVTAQLCPLGCVVTVTSYDPPVGTGDEKVKVPFAAMVTLLAPLSLSTTLAPFASPETVPETVKSIEPSVPE